MGHARGANGGSTADKKVGAAVDDVSTRYFNNMALVVDRTFLHRRKTVAGKDTNAHFEVGPRCDSLINNGGAVRGDNVNTHVPKEAAPLVEVGDPIRLAAKELERLAAEYFAELEDALVT